MSKKADFIISDEKWWHPSLFMSMSQIEADEKLDDGSIMRWCKSVHLPYIWYVCNNNGSWIHPDLVRANKVAILKNKRGL